jgi:hypothetical protein
MPDVCPSPPVHPGSVSRAAVEPKTELERVGSGFSRNDECIVAVQLRPDFAACGRHLIGFYVKTTSLRDALLDGLQQAGLNL